MQYFDVLFSIFKAQEEGYVNAYIVVPTLVHGKSLGPVRKLTVVYKFLVPDALQKKKVAYVGEGTVSCGAVSFYLYTCTSIFIRISLYFQVHIADLAALFCIVFKILVDNGDSALPTSVYERYIIANSEHFEHRAFAKEYARALHALGKVESPEPVGMSFEEVGGIVAT